MPRNESSDPWDARSLEWATHSPIPEYNFAVVPTVDSTQAFWDSKKNKTELFKGKYEPIHMPNNSGMPFVLGVIFTFWGFFMVFSWWIPAIISTVAIFACLIHRSFEQDHGRYISVEEREETEKELGGADV